ncbi:hypothetical protein NPIL_236521 [Nephila pilipes]|uniref:Uncharacterized protein n=1 Tax=Nephila pilipes TaxID=299642 RepID=A0A8X6N7I6_NEPPI|nr:hypothetical protein NPIL_236521 [Nephila pilipes]
MRLIRRMIPDLEEHDLGSGLFGGDGVWKSGWRRSWRRSANVGQRPFTDGKQRHPGGMLHRPELSSSEAVISALIRGIYTLFPSVSSLIKAGLPRVESF